MSKLDLRRPRLAVAAGLLLALAGAIAFSFAQRPSPTLHYAPNGNFSKDGHYLPGQAGFNLADVNSPAQLESLPDGVKGLVWIGQCGGADAKFVDAVKPYLGSKKLFGFFLMDDPDPRPISGAALRAAYCPASNMKAESDWIHDHAPRAKTFVVLMNLTSRLVPTFGETYAPANSHIDLFGIDPYPCRTELGGCDVAMIERYVKAAEAAGIPRARMVPIYQAFGGGDWKNESGGQYTMPTAIQLREMLTSWHQLIAAPQFDFAYSWGSQRSDMALEDSRDLKEAFLSRNTTPLVNSQ